MPPHRTSISRVKSVAQAPSLIFVALAVVACVQGRKQMPLRKAVADAAPTALDASRLPLPSEPKINLLAFVGRRIEVTRIKEPLPAPEEDGTIVIQMDSLFEARYEVLEVVFGEYSSREITFRVADHYGLPDFSKYPVVLLYVSRGPKGWYHQKYVFDRLVRNGQGQWAGATGASLAGLFGARKRGVLRAREVFPK